ncbi:hypothetical protein [Novipirellula aureliae]|uniref:hypothetical protein n=1 Tax=Novipirellula aureliae TaxID=2527966 RepID=UPI0011B4AB42|nr:hypothetical protein [Novipirellula aureliae]
MAQKKWFTTNGSILEDIFTGFVEWVVQWWASVQNDSTALANATFPKSALKRNRKTEGLRRVLQPEAIFSVGNICRLAVGTVFSNRTAANQNGEPKAVRDAARGLGHRLILGLAKEWLGQLAPQVAATGSHSDEDSSPISSL